MPMFVGVTAEKLVGDLSAEEPNFFKTLIKVKYTLLGKISSGKSFRWAKVFITKPIFRHFSPIKSFSSDVMTIFDFS